MQYYHKGENLEEELTKDNIDIECLPENFLWMHVKGGTKVTNVIEYARKSLDSGEYRSIVWSGSGGGVVKTISCAEILKRHYDLHQITRICYQNIEECWDPIIEGLEQIAAIRRIPCIHILLTLDDIDSTIPGYQHSKMKTKFYEETKISTNDNNIDGNKFGSRGERKGRYQNQNKKQGFNQNKYQKHKNVVTKTNESESGGSKIEE